MFAVVLIINPSSAKELILTYAIREGQSCFPGMLFSVSVKGRIEKGLILRLQKERKVAFTILELGEALFPYPLIGRRGLSLIRWMSRYYICPLNRTAALFLPPAIRPVQETRYYAKTHGEKTGGAGILFIDPAWQFLWDGIEKAGRRGMSARRIRQRWDQYALAKAEK